MTAKTKIKIGTLLSGLALLFSEGHGQAQVTLPNVVFSGSAEPAARCTSADYYHRYYYTVDGQGLVPGQTGTSVDVHIDGALDAVFPKLPVKDCYTPCGSGGLPCVTLCDAANGFIQIIPELRYWDSTRRIWVTKAWGDRYQRYGTSSFSNVSHPYSLGSTTLGTLGTVLGGTQFAFYFYRFPVDHNYYYNVRIWFRGQYVSGQWTQWSPVSIPGYLNGGPLDFYGTPAGYCQFAR